VARHAVTVRVAFHDGDRPDVNADETAVGTVVRALDVLVVGAGPTGLTLAAQLRAFGARFRLIDRQLDRAHESRALAIQPRTLEVLAGLGISAEMIAAGNPTVQLRMHLRRRTVSMGLFDIGIADTAYPFLLFLSQAETERILSEHLHRNEVEIERGVHLVDLDATAGLPICRLRHSDGRTEIVRPRYVVGCDGAHSTVRQHADIAFTGSAYPQTFLLADLEVDGLEAGAAHTYMAEAGMLFFFPLGTPATWRMLAMRPATMVHDVSGVKLTQLQAIADAYTTDRLTLHDPVWMTDFRLHNRGAKQYRAGPFFLAGDAAHIHSPAGAQGMNTGIQDAVNLGWKLALVTRGLARPALLDSYEPERAPVGRAVLRFTDRAFTIATTTNPLLRLARTRVAPRLAPLALRLRPARAAGFRILSQLAVHYRRSPAVTDGPHPSRRGPKAGDRLPDAPVTRDGTPITLHSATARPAGYHLLLCGPAESWSGAESNTVARRYPGLLSIDRLSGVGASLGILHDADGAALRRLGLSRADVAQILIRPDGHIGYRAGDTDFSGLERYVDRWLVAPS
jgi:2-polyprenyl-6-methoxyphenol hydroxylase-like FAD-dependent oxidoreductase